MGDSIEKLADRALAAVAKRRLRFPNVFNQVAFDDALAEFGSRREIIVSEVGRLASWNIDRAELIQRARLEFAGRESQAELKDMGEILTDMARDSIRENLISEGMNSADAARAATLIDLGMPPLRDDETRAARIEGK